MKYFTLGLLVLLFSFGVQAAANNTDSKEQSADDSKNGRQFFLPSGPGAIPINVTDDKKKSIESIKEKWGVGNFKVRLTAADYMLDVRYYVFDSTKAKPLFSRKLRPFAIEESSGVKYGVPASPKVGFLRQAPQFVKENKEYFLMIANPGKRIKSGDKLTLVIGDFRIKHLTVE